ncbi:hypothetical protein EYZ11_000177 [Aspergillus tanneri]|uniref:Uncharacterized protein n=1 Tax=Aspergillus tanneri TaxID=1220188 RepID=A0A4S3JY30_9EURO|nr:hypothetical protein EYZ11_000177 [Aspergillus tanneri]
MYFRPRGEGRYKVLEPDFSYEPLADRT